MAEWEYLVESVGVPRLPAQARAVESTLNELGLEQWELVSAMLEADGVLLIFKRPLSTAAS